MSSFIKKIFHLFLLPIFAVMFFSSWAYPTNAAPEISSVSYAHKTIKSMKNIDVPIPSTAEPKQLNSVAYLMKQIDDANEILNNSRVTNYAKSDLALRTVMVTTAADKYIDELIKKMGSVQMTVEGIDSFNFELYSFGDFYIDWGDGTTEIFTNPILINAGEITHDYPSVGNYTITLKGYSKVVHKFGLKPNMSSISFRNTVNKEKITSLSGRMGDIFKGQTCHRFSSTFSGCSGLKKISNDLFAGIHCSIGKSIFQYTFAECTGLTEIPDDLFADVSIENPEDGENTFNGMFWGCTGLKKLPPGLFAGVSLSGKAAPQMFTMTFYGCTGLTGVVPAGFFGKFSGTPAEEMFSETFKGCSGLTGIEDGIWDISEMTNMDAPQVFNETFADCPNITSSSPTVAAGSNKKLWQHFTWLGNQHTFSGATQLADYDEIPNDWK